MTMEPNKRCLSGNKDGPPGLSELVEGDRPAHGPAPPEPALDLPRRHPEFSRESVDVLVRDLLLRLQRASVALLEDGVGGRRTVRLGLQPEENPERPEEIPKIRTRVFLTHSFKVLSASVTFEMRLHQI